MQKANDQQVKMIRPQKARLKAPNVRIFTIKSGSNQTEMHVIGNSPPFTFPLSSIRLPGG